MPTHLTARLAWHADGWNGSVCKEPELNSYCVGWKSYPGDVIARERNIEAEKRHAGCLANTLKGYVPPCCYSYNAFGLENAPAASNPPEFFYGGAKRVDWTLGKHFSIAVVSCQASSSPFVHFPTVIVHRLARFSLLSEVGAMAAT